MYDLTTTYLYWNPFWNVAHCRASGSTCLMIVKLFQESADQSDARSDVSHLCWTRQMTVIVLDVILSAVVYQLSP